MTKMMIAAALLCAAASSTVAQAADNKHLMPIADALTANDAQNRLGTDVKFFFGSQRTPKVLSKLGNDKTSQKTNAFRKTNETACNWVFLSGMLQLEKKARELGANAVINIVSNYGNVEFSSDTQFECHVGNIMAGAAFKGDFVKIAQ